MNFGAALDQLKTGARIARAGWNGAGQWLILVPGSTITVDADRPLGKAAPELVGQQVSYAPHVDIFTTDRRLFPWTPSQSDQLAEDWMVVGPVSFTVNHQAVTMASSVVSYEEIANLAGMGPERCPTVTYHRAAGPKSSGSLVMGESVEVAEGTRITCMVTGRA